MSKLFTQTLPIAQQSGDVGGILFTLVFGGIFLLVGVVIIYTAYRKADLTYDFRRQSAKNVGSLTDGSVAKVKGTVRKKNDTTKAPVGDVSNAVLFDYELEKYVDDHDDTGGHWRTVEQEQQNVGFYIEDETGNEVLVPSSASPDVYMTDNNRTRKRATKGGADFDIDTLNIGNVTVGGRRMRHTQKAFTPGDDIIVFGTAKKMSDSGFEGPSMKVTNGSAIEHYAVTDTKDGLPSYLETIAIAIFGLIFAAIGGGVLLTAIASFL